MSNIIKIENLSKKYIIGHQTRESYSTLRDVLVDKAKYFGERLIHPSAALYAAGKREELWALKDINLEIKQGEKLGIIGRNGAGKTTLLKVLSRITEPTKGRVTLRGRVASLLEVGTGFHPELTGRENIYLNGAILGMSRVDIKRKFDEIVAFAEIEKFLDTPIKRYSSGMYVRLAFAVAAHLEPDILVVDEVLAVGDFEYQKKCLGKMKEVGQEGRTVLFVSHRMPQIASLCTKVILLEQGELKKSGAPTEVIQTYYTKEGSYAGSIDFTQPDKRVGDNNVQLLSSRIINQNGEIINEVLINESFILEMDYQVLREGLDLNARFFFSTVDGTLIFISTDVSDDPKGEKKKHPGKYRARCVVPGNLLNEGICYIGLAVVNLRVRQHYAYMPDVLQINIIDPIEGVKTRGSYSAVIPGAVRPLLDWSSKKIE